MSTLSKIIYFISFISFLICFIASLLPILLLFPCYSHTSMCFSTMTHFLEIWMTLKKPYLLLQDLKSQARKSQKFSFDDVHLVRWPNNSFFTRWLQNYKPLRNKVNAVRRVCKPLTCLITSARNYTIISKYLLLTKSYKLLLIFVM